MKRILMLAMVALGGAFGAKAEHVWTGAAGDGEFFTPGNWSVDGEPVTDSISNSLSDDFTINGSVVVNYTADKGDMIVDVGKTLRISGGATLRQAHGAWPDIKGRLFIENGLYEITYGVTFRIEDTGSLDVTKDGTLKLAGGFSPAANSAFTTGNFVLSGELQPKNGAQLAGANWTCSRITPEINSTIEFSSGSITVTDPGYNGFYQHGTAHLDVPAGGKIVLTLAIPPETEITEDLAWSKTFGSTRFTYDGDALQDKAAFLELFTWKDNGDHTLTIRAKALDEDGSGMELGDVAVALSPTVQTTATITATIKTVGSSELTGMVLRYGTNRNLLDAEVALDIPGDLADGGTVEKTLENLVPNKRYYFRVELTNAAEETSRSSVAYVDTYIPQDGVFVWTGAIDNNANDARNWLGGTIPGEDADVEIVDVMVPLREQNRTINWTIPKVRSVTHRSFAGDQVTVKFFTTLQTPFVVTGNVTLEHAFWMSKEATDAQSGAAPEYALNAEVGGSCFIDADSIIHAGREYNRTDSRASGYYRFGPGYFDVAEMFEPSEEFPTFNQDARFALHKLYGRAGSFGGDGGYRVSIFQDGAPSFTSYGSILNPLVWGASGQGDGPAFAGGGVVRLVIAGALTLDGAIQSVGFGYPNFNNGNSVGASSGGSINLTAASIAGSGSISADGGCDEEGGNGSGGRVRVKLTGATSTFEDFDVSKITARGGTSRDGTYQGAHSGVVDAAAGTIALQTAADDNATAGTVIVRNRIRKIGDETVPVGATHFPSMQDGDTKLTGVRLVVEADTFVKLTKDVTVASLTFEGDVVKRGSYTAAQLNSLLGKDMFSGTGILTVGSKGFALFIR